MAPRDTIRAGRLSMSTLGGIVLLLVAGLIAGWYLWPRGFGSAKVSTIADGQHLPPDTNNSLETSDQRNDIVPVSTGPDSLAGTVVTPQARERWSQQRRGLDPEKAGWKSESFTENANTQLKTFGKLFAHPDQISERQLDQVVTHDFSCTPLLPQKTQCVFEDHALRVVRGIIDSTALQTQPSGRHRGIAGLLETLAKLAGPLRHSSDTRYKFKLFNVEPSENSVTTRQYLSLSGRTEDAFIEQNATWLIRWTTDSAETLPRIDWIGVEQFEQAVTQNTSKPLFSDCTASTLGGTDSFQRQMNHGINYWVERIEAANDFYFFEHTGLAVGDANGDGLDDVYVCQQGGLPNCLYLQQPDGTVRDASVGSGVNLLDLSYSALFVDLNNDGHQDLVVSTRFYLVIFAGDGTGRFKPETRVKPGRGYSISAADYDLDGDLDIYSTIYYASRRDASSLPVPAPYHDANNGGRNFMIRNDGNWQFSDVTIPSGLNENNTRFSLAANWEDYDNDGDPDLYVANDFGRNNLYRNDNGKFTDVAAAAGVEDGAFGMSVSWADYNHDGFMDIYVANMFSAAGNRVTYQRHFRPDTAVTTKTRLQHTARGNTLFENQGDGTFRDVSTNAGVTMGRWGWASLFADINNDSWDDLVLANGYFTGSEPDDL